MLAVSYEISVIHVAFAAAGPAALPSCDPVTWEDARPERRNIRNGLCNFGDARCIHGGPAALPHHTPTSTCPRLTR
jgi:hypothetical protein